MFQIFLPSRSCHLVSSSPLHLLPYYRQPHAWKKFFCSYIIRKYRLVFMPGFTELKRVVRWKKFDFLQLSIENTSPLIFLFSFLLLLKYLIFPYNKLLTTFFHFRIFLNFERISFLLPDFVFIIYAVATMRWLIIL